MPIGAFEREILRLLATNRNPESYVGGATILLQSPESPRTSQDVDVFHDSIESVQISAGSDLSTLRAAGYRAETAGRSYPSYIRAVVERDGLQTKVEWVVDSAFRFFPTEADEELGWRLNFWDAATNKVLALAGREKLRDLVDVLHLHRARLPLGVLAWAAAAKDPGFTPEQILAAAGRFAGIEFSGRDVLRLGLREPLSPVELRRGLLDAVADGEKLIAGLPPTEMGCFYLDAAGKPVCPDPDSPDFEKLTRHFGGVKGAVPRIAEE